jgi:hypothetical protein
MIFLTLGRIQRSLERSPESFDGKQSFFLFVLADLDGVVESVSPDQSKYVNSLEIRLKSSQADVQSKETEVLTLQTKLDKQVYLAKVK